MTDEPTANEPTADSLPPEPDDRTAAWKLIGGGVSRYWDGNQWTEHIYDPAAPKAARTRRRVPLAALVWTSVGALILGVLIGGVGGSGAQSRVSALEDQLEEAESKVDVAQQQARDAKNEAQQLEQDLADREAAVAAREAAVQSVEDAIAAGTFSGNGLYIVGADIQPGTYRSEGGSNCYWARLNATGDDIIDNYIGSGQTIVTVQPSDGLLEVSGCAEFTLVQ